MMTLIGGGEESPFPPGGGGVVTGIEYAQPEFTIGSYHGMRGNIYSFMS